MVIKLRFVVIVRDVFAVHEGLELFVGEAVELIGGIVMGQLQEVFAGCGIALQRELEEHEFDAKPHAWNGQDAGLESVGEFVVFHVPCSFSVGGSSKSSMSMKFRISSSVCT